MKTHFFSKSLLIITLIVMLVSCKKDDDNSPANNSASTSSILTTGSWHVSYFHESSNDHTSNFSGYTFNFNTNGTMTAMKSSVTTNGTWSVDDSNNEFHMSIGNDIPLNELSKGWIINSKTSTEIKMIDDNTTHNEELHFVKN